MEHVNISAGEIHAPHQWRPADEAERLSISVVASDHGKYALQLDTNTEWMLVNHDPVAWKRRDGGYEHTQGVPETTWSVTHNLDKFPAVTVVDSDGYEVEGQVTYLSRNAVQLDFAAAFSGKAYLN